MNAIALWCQVVVGGVFALSAAGKLRDLRAFARAVGDFAVVPASLTAPVAAALVVLECIVPVLLLFRPTALGGLLLAAALLAVFTAGLLGVLRRGAATACNCFGSASSRPVGRVHIWRNAALLVVSGSGVAALHSGDAGVLAEPVALVTALCALPCVVAVRFLDDLVDLFARPHIHATRRPE